jgi:hypothetical protein
VFCETRSQWKSEITKKAPAFTQQEERHIVFGSGGDEWEGSDGHVTCLD